jgi:hypothetical protein
MSLRANPRWTAGLVLSCVFAGGLLVGVAVDRVWTSRRPAPETAAPPLTVDALADSLHLDPAERARVHQVAESLDAEILAASGQGAESLRAAAQRARQRLEGALPSDRRPQFQTWMEQHHARMMQLMQRPGGMGSGTAGTGGMMGPMTGQPGGMMGGAMQGMMGTPAVPTVRAESLPERGDRGARLEASYCGRCHGIPNPAAHSAAEWPAVVERMLEHMRSVSVTLPDSAETATILAYLRAHASRTDPAPGDVH